MQRVSSFILQPYRIDFEFADDPHQTPKMVSTGVLTAGAEWMRLHFPRQWAAFCAARLLGKRDVTVIKLWWHGFAMWKIPS